MPPFLWIPLGLVWDWRNFWTFLCLNVSSVRWNWRYLQIYDMSNQTGGIKMPQRLKSDWQHSWIPQFLWMPLFQENLGAIGECPQSKIRLGQSRVSPVSVNVSSLSDLSLGTLINTPSKSRGSEVSLRFMIKHNVTSLWNPSNSIVACVYSLFLLFSTTDHLIVISFFFHNYGVYLFEVHV